MAEKARSWKVSGECKGKAEPSQELGGWQGCNSERHAARTETSPLVLKQVPSRVIESPEAGPRGDQGPTLSSGFLGE